MPLIMSRISTFLFFFVWVVIIQDKKSVKSRFHIFFLLFEKKKCLYQIRGTLEKEM